MNAVVRGAWVGLAAAIVGCAPGFRTYVPRGEPVDCNGGGGGGRGGLRAVYARRPCDGHCPVYEVSLCGDGTVVYDGLIFVKTPGRRTKRLPAERLTALLGELDRIPEGPGPLADPLGPAPPHLAHWVNGARRWLANKTPEGARTSDVFVDAVGVAEWVGTDVERERLWKDSR